jgi:hypothetical protein
MAMVASVTNTKGQILGINTIISSIHVKDYYHEFDVVREAGHLSKHEHAIR